MTIRSTEAAPGPGAPRLTRMIDEIDFDERGLAPCVIQDAGTGEVLTLAWVNAESLQRTI